MKDGGQLRALLTESVVKVAPCNVSMIYACKKVPHRYHPIGYVVCVATCHTEPGSFFDGAVVRKYRIYTISSSRPLLQYGYSLWHWSAKQAHFLLRIQ